MQNSGWHPQSRNAGSDLGMPSSRCLEEASQGFVSVFAGKKWLFFLILDCIGSMHPLLQNTIHEEVHNPREFSLIDLSHINFIRRAGFFFYFQCPSKSFRCAEKHNHSLRSSVLQAHPKTSLRTNYFSK